MKIGILTLPLHTNYGGILQAYALQTVLERMGHEVELLETPYIIHRPWWRNTITFAKRLALKTVGKSVSLNYQKEHNIRERTKRKYVNVFIQQHIKRRELKSYDAISSADYDAIVVGSDQVWRQKFMPKMDVRNPFLVFTEGWNIKRIAYAASFGSDKWEYTEENTITAKKAIQRFDAVSIREHSGVTLCKDYLDYHDAEQVLDPTLLLDRIDYEHIIEESDSTHKINGSLMCYVLDYSNEKRQYISECAKVLDMIPFETNSKYEVKGASLEEIVQPPVEQWLRSFRDSSYVITDSFHACVFSILFHKQFIVIGNHSRGLARFHSLLSLFGLEDRMVTENLDVSLCDRPIDWDRVDTKLKKWREFSKSFLEKALY